MESKEILKHREYNQMILFRYHNAVLEKQCNAYKMHTRKLSAAAAWLLVIGITAPNTSLSQRIVQRTG